MGFVVERVEGRLALRALHRPDWKPLSADWLSAEQRRRIEAGRRQLLPRALGLNRRSDLRILDATGGLGRDGFTLAALGASVCIAERQPLVAQLLEDARQRALACDEALLRAAAARVLVLALDAGDLVADELSAFDAAHLDPMYPDDGKSALPQKGMQMLRELAGDDLDAGTLLQHLRAHVPRVAVKRPLKAPWLGGQRPDAVTEGTQARFDLYLRTR
ncbi:MAG: class I SAM-dependent methyltransferase [Panacagrimonas sp.]